MRDELLPGKDILEIQDLSVAYTSAENEIPVLRNINLRIKKGQVYGLVGESGSGKSTLGLAVMRHLPTNGKVIQGKIILDSRDLLAIPRKDLRNIWGREISYVPQDLYSSLNPSMRIGDQLIEVFLTHTDLSKNDAKGRSLGWISRVHLPNPDLITRKYPHELSGGQIQRILAAMALANHPQLLVLDEPTTSLDVTTEAVILELLGELIREENTSALFITHNLGIVNKITDRVAVLYAGELVEDAPTDLFMQDPIHPYSQGLLMSIPKIGLFKKNKALVDIPGQVPALGKLPKGCVFAPRCQLALDRCHNERPPLEFYRNDSSVRCFRWREIQAGKIKVNTPERSLPPNHLPEDRTVLSVQNLGVDYKIRTSPKRKVLAQKQEIKAVNDVSFQVGKGRTLGIVGESGSGKTSLALAIMGLIDSATGAMDLLEMQLPTQLSNRNDQMLRNLQMVFQNHDDIFPPYLTVQEILIRPLLNLAGLGRKKAEKRAKELLALVHLPENYIHKYPLQLSGGEKQRVAIARAVALNPDLLVADEPISSLDASVQASILNLLNEVQQEYRSSTLLISHNIAVVTYMADELLVMYLGQIMQHGKPGEILSAPYHPYTETLLSSLPEMNPDNLSAFTLLETEPIHPLESPKGCPFHSRCPRSLGRICADQVPPRQSTPGGGMIFCHIPISVLKTIQKDLFPIDRVG